MHILNPYRFTSATFSPSDISGLTLWLDSVDTSTLWQDSAKTTAVSANNDPVGYWADKSGNNNDWLQATSGDRPTYKTNFNTSYPAIYFDGTAGKNLDGNLSESAGDWTIFAVVNRTDLGEYIFDFQTGRFILAQQSASGGFGWYDGSWKVGSNLATDGTPYVIIFKANSTGTSGNIEVNGTSWVTAVYSQQALGGVDQAIGSRYNSGSGLEWTGHIASMLIYSGNLSTGDITSVEDYLKDRYGISY